MKSKTRQAIIPRPSTAKRLVGTDISAWQGTVRWEKIPSDFNYVIMRASIGLQRDSEFKDNWKGAAQVRKNNEQFRRGAYHVIKYDLPVREQAELFLDTTLGEWKVGDLPGSLDVEGSLVKAVGGMGAAAKTVEWLELCTRWTGRRPQLYIADDALDGMLKDPKAAKYIEKFNGYPLWYVEYWKSEPPIGQEPTLPKPLKRWTFWQWTSKGDGPAWTESNGLDLNYFNGSVLDLEAYAKREFDFSLNEAAEYNEQRLGTLEAADARMLEAFFACALDTASFVEVTARFQRKNRLTVDGKAGPITTEKVRRAYEQLRI